MTRNHDYSCTGLPWRESIQNYASGGFLWLFGGHGTKMIEITLLVASCDHLAALARKCSKLRFWGLPVAIWRPQREIRLRLPQHFVAPSLPLTKIRRVAFRDKPHTKSTALSPHVYLQGILLSGLRMRSAN